MYTELESLRGFAALLVFFYHIPTWNESLKFQFMNNAHLMVDLFFVLSGFVIFNAYGEKIKTKKDLIRFQFLRFARLYPVHFVFLVIYAILEFAKYLATHNYGIVNPNASNVQVQQNPFLQFIENLFLMHAVLPYRNLSFNFPSWSISVEFYTYLLFACIVFFFNKRKTIIFSFISGCSILFLVTKNTFGFNSLLQCFSGFFMGCIVAILNKTFNKKIPILSPLFFILVTFLFLQFKTPNKLDFIIYFISAGLILSVIKDSSSTIKKILNIRIFIWLGTISYSFYMSHAFSIWIINQSIRFILKKKEAIINGRSWPQLSVLETVSAYVIQLIFALFISYLVHVYIEKPFREKSRKYASDCLN
jgi:peptidoglycan/LPS O-acetylase OafA/YrhL